MHLELYPLPKVLPQGLSYSCALFESFSSAIHWIIDKKLGISCAHILDDFLFVGTKNYQKCLHCLQNKLVLSLHHTSNTYYVCMMVRAMYLLAFYALLRVGEFTTSSNQNVIVHATDIKFNHNLFFKSPII